MIALTGFISASALEHDGETAEKLAKAMLSKLLVEMDAGRPEPTDDEIEALDIEAPLDERIEWDIVHTDHGMSVTGIIGLGE